MVHVDAGSSSALLPQPFRNFDRSEPPVSIIDLSCTPQLQDEAHHFVLSPNSSSLLIAAVEYIGNLVIGACRSAAFASTAIALAVVIWFARRAASSCYSFVVEKQHLSDGILVVNANN